MMAHEQRLADELASLEAKYRMAVKQNPSSIQDTREHLKDIDAIVSRMKAIRNSKTINRPVSGNNFLKEILYA